jgi:hypothetical protein
MALLSQIASSFSKRDYRKRDRVIRRIDLSFGAICGEWLNRAIPHMSHKITFAHIFRVCRLTQIGYDIPMEGAALKNVITLALALKGSLRFRSKDVATEIAGLLLEELREMDPRLYNKKPAANGVYKCERRIRTSSGNSGQWASSPLQRTIKSRLLTSTSYRCEMRFIFIVRTYAFRNGHSSSLSFTCRDAG